MSCNGNCDSCGSKGSCDEIKKFETTSDSKIGKIVAVFSGKGGVGKSSVTSLLAVELAKSGKKVGILDSDFTGPSIPKMFGVETLSGADNESYYPGISKLGIKIVSINFMLESEDTPLLWRGPLLGGLIKEFYSKVHWGELDYLLIDMPPGTRAVALTLFQSVPVDEIVMVTTPSKLVSMVVSKSINMANMLNLPIVAVVDNMAYVKCDECGHNIMIYNKDDSADVCAKYGLNLAAKMPIDIEISNLCDEGKIEEYDGSYLSGVLEVL